MGPLTDAFITSQEYEKLITITPPLVDGKLFF